MATETAARASAATAASVAADAPRRHLLNVAHSGPTIALTACSGATPAIETRAAVAGVPSSRPIPRCRSLPAAVATNTSPAGSTGRRPAESPRYPSAAMAGFSCQKFEFTIVLPGQNVEDAFVTVPRRSILGWLRGEYR